MKTYLYRASNSLFWPLFNRGSQFLASAKKRRFLRFIHTNNNYIFFIRVFSECTETIATSLVTNFPEICAFIIGFSFTVWTKLAH